MKKINFLFIALAIAISLNCLAPVMVYAEEEKSKTEEEEKIKKEKESILALIDEYIDEINTRIIEADKKIFENDYVRIAVLVCFDVPSCDIRAGNTVQRLCAGRGQVLRNNRYDFLF